MIRYACFFVCVLGAFHVDAKYPYNPNVSSSKWEALEPHFLPENHPIKKKLDKIFSERVSKNEESMRTAGFKFVKMGRANRPKIVSHPEIAGYLLKLYFDSQLNTDETINFRKRIKGARIAREIIQSNNYEHLFRVPQKWIYPLPPDTLPQKGKSYEPKNFILVVEEMDIYKKEDNIQCWRTWFTEELVVALYTVLEVGGFSDSTFVFNLPFTKDGKIAIIDTEIYSSWPINYERLNQYFSTEMLDYWLALTD